MHKISEYRFNFAGKCFDCVSKEYTKQTIFFFIGIVLKLMSL